jgi:hypothetical protein
VTLTDEQMHAIQDRIVEEGTAKAESLAQQGFRVVRDDNGKPILFGGYAVIDASAGPSVFGDA